MAEDGDRMVRITTTPPMEGRQRRRYLFITPATGGQEVVALGQSIAWVMTHWNPDKQTVEAHYEHGHCALCEVTKPVWIGFLAVYSEKMKVAGLLPVPWEAWSNSDSLKRLNGKLRGRAIYSSRKVPRKNGPVRMAVLDKQVYIKLPDAFDVTDAVCRHLNITPADIFDKDVEDVRITTIPEGLPCDSGRV